MTVRTATPRPMWAQIQARLQTNLTSFLLVFVSLGFLFLLAELLLTDHTEGIQLVAVGASTLGALLGFVGLFVRGRLRYVAVLLFLVLALTGVVGVIEHNEARLEAGESETSTRVQWSSGTTLVRYTWDEDEEEEDEESEAPPLAPLSLSGLSALGAMALLARDPAA